MSPRDRMNESILDLGDVPRRPPATPTVAPTDPGTSVGDVTLASQPAGPANRSTAKAEEPAPGRARSPEPGAARERNAPPKRGNGGLWAVVVLLALALAGVSAYSYTAFRKNNLSLSQLPGMQSLVNGLGQRLNSTEAEVRGLAANWQGVSNQVAALDRKVGSSLVETRRGTERLVAQAENRMDARLNQRDQAIESRLARVESGQAAEHQRLAQLRTEMGGVEQEAAAESQDTGRQLSALNDRANQNASQVSELSRSLQREKVTFEAAQQNPSELAPGVSLVVTKTDTAYQRFNGYLALTDTGRTVWLRDVAAREAVTFYAADNGHPYDLVATTIKSGGIAGYLLMPAGEVPDNGQGAAGEGAGGSAQ